MCTVLRQVQQSHPWFCHPQWLILGTALISSADGELTTSFLQVLAQHGHLCHSHRGEWGPPALAPSITLYTVAQGLPKPDLVLLLTVSPEERMQRIEGRGMEKTREEAELETNSIFRAKSRCPDVM